MRNSENFVMSFTVILFNSSIAISHLQLMIQASADVGTDLHYYWNPGDDSSYITTNNANLTYTYNVVDIYYPFVIAGNVLGNETASYTLAVQDAVSGLFDFCIYSTIPFVLVMVAALIKIISTWRSSMMRCDHLHFVCFI